MRPRNPGRAPAAARRRRSAAGSGTTALSSSSCAMESAQDRLEDPVRVPQIGEDRVGSAGGQLLDGVGAGCDGDRACADPRAARDVGRRVSDNDDLGAGGLPSEERLGPSRRDRREVGPVRRVGAVGADAESGRIEPGRPELERRARARDCPSAGRARPRRVFPVDPGFGEAGHEAGAGGCRQLPLQQADVALADRADARSVVRSRISRRRPQQLGHDLGIGLAVEADPLERRRCRPPAPRAPP